MPDSLPNWDLTNLYDEKGNDARVDLKKVSARAEKLAAYNGKLEAESAETLSEIIAEYQSISELLSRIISHADLKFAADMSASANGQYAQDMRIAGGARSTPQPGRSGPGYVDAYAHMDQRGYGRDQRDYRDQRQPRAHDRYDQRGMYDMITPKMKPVRHGQPLQDAYSRTPGAPVSQYVSPLPAQAHTAPRAYHSGGRREDKRRR